MKNKPSFEVSKADKSLIDEIVIKAGWLIGGIEPLGLAMDLTATHANGCPLKLAALLQADDFNFCHDIRGIQAHLNRTTGKIERFLPRYAV
jgi:hypothetical protein